MGGAGWGWTPPPRTPPLLLSRKRGQAWDGGRRPCLGPGAPSRRAERVWLRTAPASRPRRLRAGHPAVKDEVWAHKPRRSKAGRTAGALPRDGSHVASAPAGRHEHDKAWCCRSLYKNRSNVKTSDGQISQTRGAMDTRGWSTLHKHLMYTCGWSTFHKHLMYTCQCSDLTQMWMYNRGRPDFVQM